MNKQLSKCCGVNESSFQTCANCGLPFTPQSPLEEKKCIDGHIQDGLGYCSVCKECIAFNSEEVSNPSEPSVEGWEKVLLEGCLSGKFFKRTGVQINPLKDFIRSELKKKEEEVYREIWEAKKQANTAKLEYRFAGLESYIEHLARGKGISL